MRTNRTEYLFSVAATTPARHPARSFLKLSREWPEWGVSARSRRAARATASGPKSAGCNGPFRWSRALSVGLRRRSRATWRWGGRGWHPETTMSSEYPASRHQREPWNKGRLARRVEHPAGTVGAAAGRAIAGSGNRCLLPRSLVRAVVRGGGGVAPARLSGAPTGRRFPGMEECRTTDCPFLSGGRKKLPCQIFDARGVGAGPKRRVPMFVGCPYSVSIRLQSTTMVRGWADET